MRRGIKTAIGAARLHQASAHRFVDPVHRVLLWLPGLSISKGPGKNSDCDKKQASFSSFFSTSNATTSPGSSRLAAADATAFYMVINRGWRFVPGKMRVFEVFLKVGLSAHVPPHTLGRIEGAVLTNTALNTACRRALILKGGEAGKMGHAIRAFSVVFRRFKNGPFPVLSIGSSFVR